MPRSLSDQLRLATLLGLALTLGAAAHEGHVHGTTSAAAAATTGHDMSGMDMGDGSMDMGGDEHMGAMTGMKMWVHGTIGDDCEYDVERSEAARRRGGETARARSTSVRVCERASVRHRPVTVVSFCAAADDVLEVLLPSVRPCRSPLPDLHMDMAKM